MLVHWTVGFMVINYNILKRFEPMIGEHKPTKPGGATFLRMAQLLHGVGTYSIHGGLGGDSSNNSKKRWTSIVGWIMRLPKADLGLFGMIPLTKHLWRGDGSIMRGVLWNTKNWDLIWFHQPRLYRGKGWVCRDRSIPSGRAWRSNWLLTTLVHPGKQILDPYPHDLRVS